MKKNKNKELVKFESLSDKKSLEAYCSGYGVSNGSVVQCNTYSCNWFSVSSTQEDSDVLI